MRTGVGAVGARQQFNFIVWPKTTTRPSVCVAPIWPGHSDQTNGPSIVELSSFSAPRGAPPSRLRSGRRAKPKHWACGASELGAPPIRRSYHVAATEPNLSATEARAHTHTWAESKVHPFNGLPRAGRSRLVCVLAKTSESHQRAGDN